MPEADGSKGSKPPILSLRPPALWPRELSLASIRGRLALLLALAFLPSGAFALQAGASALAARHAAVQGEEGIRVMQRLVVVRDEATQMREAVRTLGTNASLFTDSIGQCRRTLTEFANTSPAIGVVAVMTRDSILQCSNVPGAEGQRIAAGELIPIAARSGDAVIGFVRSPTLSGEPVIAAVSPSSSSPALFVGATRPANALLQSGARPDGFAALIDIDGEILDSVGLDRAGLDAARLQRAIRDAPADAQQPAIRLSKLWAVSTPIEAGQLYLVAGWEPAPLGWAGWARAIWALLAPVLIWAAAVAVTWYAVEIYVARPLLVVESLARAYARGEDSESETAMLRGAPSEIASLRRTLAALAKTLRGREARLTEALREERALLLEVNHRVKNNLQMVASILSIQARATVDESEARGLSRAQDRVQLLALAHAHIYSSGEVRDVALDQLTADIARTLISARGGDADTVQLELHLENVRASVDRAVPLAFLVGESIVAVLDHIEGSGSVPLKITVANRDGGGFCVEIDAEGVSGGSELRAAERLVSAFARQVDADVTRDPSRPFYLRIESRAGLPHDA